MITKTDIANCLTTAREAEILPSRRLELRRQQIRRLHAQNKSIQEIMLLVFGVDTSEAFDNNPFRAIDLSAYHAQRVAALEREIISVIEENPLAVQQEQNRPAPQEVGRPRKDNGQFKMRGS